MTILLWTLVVMFSLQIIGKLVWFVRGGFPDRDPRSEAIDVVVYILVLVWIASILSRSAT